MCILRGRELSCVLIHIFFPFLSQCSQSIDGGNKFGVMA